MALPKTYQANKYEQKIYDEWEKTGAFQPKKGKGDPFSIVLPPPNATGQLHLGHAVMIAIEDTFVRFARMQGRETVWIPGTDHAAIATENVVIRKLVEQGYERPREELGREQVLQAIREFVAESRDTIRTQVKATGASVDWTRERYTMDRAQSNIVNRVFVDMYNDGLIYRGNRIVNWDPNLETNVSDDEVDHRTQKTPFYTFKYGPFKISTARPETKFGDKYVVVHPDDERYAEWEHGQEFEAEWINGKIVATVIKDEAIDPEFGTGAMTITPWHDHTDFEIAQRHNLDAEQIIALDGTLLPIAGEFSGMPIAKARPKIVKKLKEKDLLLGTDENYEHSIAINSRGKGVIEPQIREQWFIDVNKPVIKWGGKTRSLKEVMLDVVKNGDINIIPKRFEKTYFHWVENLRDWCISRQIWWGHRIPAWYNQNGEVFVDTHPPMVNKKRDQHSDKGNLEAGWQQDPDTLDTWFSSALWTWSTLVDQELAAEGEVDLSKLLKKSKDFKKYHPTTLLETGYDILPFWVARMILMTTYATGEIPFKNVYLHGMVLTRDGQKMSKSDPESAIDPLEMIDEYGADALRLSMLIGQTPGNDNRLYKEKIAGYRNFCNKLWNVGRYILENVPESELYNNPKIETAADAWIFNQVQDAIQEITTELKEYRVSDAGQKIYHLLWDNFADWYVEANKANSNGPLLAELYRSILKLAHPLAPFVTEALWRHFGDNESMLATTEWPEPQKRADKEQADGFEELQKIVSEIRELKSDLQLNSTSLYYDESEFLDEHGELVVMMTGIKQCKKVVDGTGLNLTRTKVHCWLDVDSNAIRTYLFSLIQTRDDEHQAMDKLESRLENKGYINNAPKEIVEETRQQKQQKEAYIKRLNKQIDSLENMIKLYQ